MLGALKNLNSYQSSHAMSNEEFNAICDINGDGLVNASDIATLEQLLVSGIQAGNGIFGGGSFASVPEPASLLLGAMSFGLFVFATSAPGSSHLIATHVCRRCPGWEALP